MDKHAEPAAHVQLVWQSGAFASLAKASWNAQAAAFDTTMAVTFWARLLQLAESRQMIEMDAASVGGKSDRSLLQYVFGVCVCVCSLCERCCDMPQQLSMLPAEVDNKTQKRPACST